MKDLTLALLGAGALIVIGVFVYNRIQESRARRLARAAFEGKETADVLFDDAPARRGGGEAAPEERVEPMVGDLADIHPAVSAAPTEPVRGDGIDPRIDAVVEIHLVRDVPANELSASLVATLESLGAAARHARVGVEDAGRWRAFASDTIPVRRLRVGLQLASRSGPLDGVALMQAFGALDKLATQLGGAAHHASASDAVQRAQDLDAFCSAVDFDIALNIEAGDNGAFAGSKLRAFVEAQGGRLRDDGVFHVYDTEDHELFVVRNGDSRPFVAAEFKNAAYNRVALLLDVPHVADPTVAFNRMWMAATGLAHALHARVVDDAGRAFAESHAEGVRRQLKDVSRLMNEADIPPGGPLALRLFA